MTEPKEIPIYIRVSSDEQVHGTSLETQLRDCRAAAARTRFESRNRTLIQTNSEK